MVVDPTYEVEGTKRNDRLGITTNEWTVAKSMYKLGMNEASVNA